MSLPSLSGSKLFMGLHTHADGGICRRSPVSPRPAWQPRHFSLAVCLQQSNRSRDRAFQVPEKHSGEYEKSQGCSCRFWKPSTRQVPRQAHVSSNQTIARCACQCPGTDDWENDTTNGRLLQPSVRKQVNVRNQIFGSEGFLIREQVVLTEI